MRSVLCIWASIVMCAVQAQGLRWDFTTGLDGWRVGRHVENLRVEDGVLKGRITGHDPQLLSPLFELKPTYLHEMAFRVKVGRGGGGQLYYTDTTEGPFDGFDAKRVRDFAVADSQDWQDIRLRPFWQGEKKIIQLRVDILHGQGLDGVDFELDWLAVQELPADAMSRDRSWDFQGGRHGDWTTESDGRLLSPFLHLDGPAYSWVLLTITSTAPAWAEFSWLSSGGSGQPVIPFLVAGDGVPHTYSLPVATHYNWIGNALQFGVQVVPEHEAPYELQRVELSDRPHPQPDLRCWYFGPAEYPNRVGDANRMVLKMENIGHAAAAGVIHFRVTEASGQRLLKDGEALVSMPYQVAATETATYDFDVLASAAGEAVVTAELRSGDAVVMRQTSKAMTVTPKPTPARRADYVPEPKPARTDYLIGSYYYPGYGTSRQWREMAISAPGTKPVLGYYDEGNPECIDWQIKWATEHGVNFFLVDWYWEAGRNRNEHWLDGFVQARHKRHFKWALMWANHNRKGTHSREDWIAVTERWLEKYIRTPEYLTIDGKPVVFMWSPRNVREDMGGSAPSAELLALSDSMAKAAGLPGMVFYAMNQGAGDELKQDGYAGYTTYHWFSNARETSRNSKFFAFKAVVDQAPENWDRVAGLCDAAGLKFLPVVDTGWDARPRHQLNTFVIYDRSVAEFARHLRDMKQWLDKRGQKMFVLGPWNEWTEGSYIEPCSEFGFEMLRAIREVFCTEAAPSDDTSPRDIGLGPYDFPLDLRVVRRDRWDFRADQQLYGWRAHMGLSDLQLAPQGLASRSVTRDPALMVAEMKFDARLYAAMEVTMSVKPAPVAKDTVALFWGSTFMPVNGNATVSCALAPDEELHTYRLDLAPHPKWQGVINQLRFDPTQRADCDIVIESIRLIPAQP